MASQYTLPTRLRDYIAFLLPWAHGHQLKAIGDFVAAIIEQQTACQAQLARYFGKQEAAVKRLSRLLHNERLDPRLLADAVLLQALHQFPKHGKVRLALTGPLKRTSICWSSPSLWAVVPSRFTGVPMTPRC